MEEKLQIIGTDVKSIKTDFKIFDEKLIRIEKNLGKLEQQLQT